MDWSGRLLAAAVIVWMSGTAVVRADDGEKTGK